MLAGFLADEVELRLQDNKLNFIWSQKKNYPGVFTNRNFMETDTGTIPCLNDNSSLENLCVELFQSKFSPELKYSYYKKSYIIPDTSARIYLKSGLSERIFHNLAQETSYNSVVLLPLIIDEANKGLLILKSYQKNFFKQDDADTYEHLADVFSISIAFRRSQVALRERIKELTCLQEINSIMQKPVTELLPIFKEFCGIIIRAFQYPEEASCKITYQDMQSLTNDFSDVSAYISADIEVNSAVCGSITVGYRNTEDIREPVIFLPEEEKMLQILSKKIGFYIEKYQSKQDNEKLEMQLRHADRLATIGTLAAGVAHELNEPLANILGFAQLARKFPENNPSIEKDLDKIIGSSLHAREIVKKLLIFSHQMPAKKAYININKVIEDAFYFLETRFTKKGIIIEKKFAFGLPQLFADASQINQVVINLAINSLHAMPESGKLLLETSRQKNGILFRIKDTGCGMTEEVKKQIFLPFFTTKDVGEGTGLGLAVVHGILKAHNAEVTVNSIPGLGTEFNILFPFSFNQVRGVNED